MSELEVWLDDVPVGLLYRGLPRGKPRGGASSRGDEEAPQPREARARRDALRYLDDWQRADQACTLGPTLPFLRPLDDEDAHSLALHRYFEHLLPEGDRRDQAARAVGVSPSDPFGLLLSPGAETAGAVRLVSARHDRSSPLQAYRPLPRAEVSERLRQRDRSPFAVWDGRLRHCLSGAQDKLAIYVDPGAAADGGDQWLLVDGPGLASTHLLKPAPGAEALAPLPFNELFCMRLAHRVGLPVAKVALASVPEPVLLVERFDRQRLADGRVSRLHVIDGAQALGLAVNGKRERAGRIDSVDGIGCVDGGDGRVERRIHGATLPDLFRLLDGSTMALADRRTLLNWVIFQLLIGNGDAHAKDLSFHVGPGGLRVAPAYDLVSTRALGQAPSMAMAIGDRFDPDEVTAADWAEFAQRCGLRPRSLAQQLAHLAKAVLDAAPTLSADLVGLVPRPVSQSILDVIVPTCERQLALAPLIPKVQLEPATP